MFVLPAAKKQAIAEHTRERSLTLTRRNRAEVSRIHGGESMTCFVQRWVSAWLLVPLLFSHLAAQEKLTGPARENLPVQYGDRPKHASRVATLHKANLEKHKGACNVLVLPGLIADRKARRVEIMAEATGLTAETIVEFLLIDASSSKGYEALLWSFAVLSATTFCTFLREFSPLEVCAGRHWRDQKCADEVVPSAGRLFSVCSTGSDAGSTEPCRFSPDHGLLL